MRSNDLGCGAPFNYFSYAVLTYIIALKCDLRSGELVYTVSDAHIYQNHVNEIHEQLKRDPRPLPKLVVNPSVKTKGFAEITMDDFELVGYFPHPGIKMAMAV
jgi:thymidylate synthase